MKNLFELFYETSGVCTDTRKIEKDCLFICLKGDKFNGNTFANQAIEAGAKFVIVDEHQFANSSSIHYVENSLLFLQQLANYHRKKFQIPFIGITGSNGKTSTKELINEVLSKKYNVLATIGNLNNHIGVPLTLLRLTEDHEIAIIEMGANRFKDIEELCQIAEPTHAIITNIGKAHLEGFGNFEGVLKTKKELYDSVEKINGAIIYNSDDSILENNLPKNVTLLSYGTEDDADIKGALIGLTPYVKLIWKQNNYSSPVLETKMVGKYNFYNYLAAISFGVCFDVPFEQINQAICNYTPENNRSQVKKTTKNTLILDCYNANPTSMRSALESFAMLDQGNKLFIIGDMLELGDQAINEHRNILSIIENNHLSGYTVGKLFKEQTSNNVLQSFETAEELRNHLVTHPIENTFVLLKGSRGIKLEIVENVL
ncbi:MAG: UDP-N-acetylmuramoyl-tripeptide--D-alanyl-D-alanine ligase [Crocinitomicaceae bacterium]|nr:UDP-N-acetylmuramoyl-tripeptide--D-alanyl-D-alanine ligase [Crocinitomicaceae bacterium]MDP4865147.1 UDP-N-acetylmuramoyl-tripeptide--D-alanyl-D-alanine ligase [Crocinitomicaceae bacterium]